MQPFALQSSSFSWFLKQLERNHGISQELLLLQHERVGDTDEGMAIPPLHPLQQSSIGFVLCIKILKFSYEP